MDLEDEKKQASENGNEFDAEPISKQDLGEESASEGPKLEKAKDNSEDEEWL